MNDPNKVFIPRNVSMTRAEIAEYINDYLEEAKNDPTEYGFFDLNYEPFIGTDERLSDRTCQFLVDTIEEISCDSKEEDRKYVIVDIIVDMFKIEVEV